VVGSFRTPVRSRAGVRASGGQGLVRGRSTPDVHFALVPAHLAGRGTRGAPEIAQTIAQNRRARHEFSVEDTFEAGLVLRGTEIKSIRAHKVSLADAYARIERGEAWIIGLHIAPWESADVRFNHEPKRMRKLLLRREQIDELLGKTKAKGLTLVPLSIYIDDRGHAKLELGLARGKQTWDRRREIAERDSKRDMARDVAEARRR
jgi:SsrA-binding protein